MDMTACFLPKPVTGVNGNGMHTNLSLARKGKNLFYDKKGEDGLSELGWSFIQRILANAQRPLPDPQLAASTPTAGSTRTSRRRTRSRPRPIDRGSMVRIPLGNERSARIEVRSIAPDANPYLAIYTLLRTGLEGPHRRGGRRASAPRTRFLPDNIYDAHPAVQGAASSRPSCWARRCTPSSPSSSSPRPSAARRRSARWSSAARSSSTTR